MLPGLAHLSVNAASEFSLNSSCWHSGSACVWCDAMAKIQARGKSDSTDPCCLLGIPTASHPGLVPCLLARDAKLWRGSSWGMGWWLQGRAECSSCFMEGLQMCRSKGKSLSKLQCRHIHLQLPAYSLFSDTCSVFRWGRAREPDSLQEAIPLHHKLGMCVGEGKGVCVCVRGSYQLSALPCHCVQLVQKSDESSPASLCSLGG